MAYFQELPNLQVKARFPNQSSSEDRITIKNLWRRGKLREDIKNVVTAFYYYQIKGDERPEQIAEKLYGDAELDWVVLLTNNIINLYDEWPMDSDTLYKHSIDKYGSEEALAEIHHTETNELRDEFNRLVIPKELKVDKGFFEPSNFVTVDGKEFYTLEDFPAVSSTTEAKINLIQGIIINTRLFGDETYEIADIQFETSNLDVYTRNSNNIKIKIINDLPNNWAAGWGGSLEVYTREEENITINIEDILSDIIIVLPERLYEVIGVFDSEKNRIVPVLRFRYLGPL